MKKKTTANIISQTQLAPGIFDLRLKTDLAREAFAGRFVAVYPKDSATLLPRPISVCEADPVDDVLRLVYRVAGKGTAEFSAYKEGDTLDILGVLGNGYDIRPLLGKHVVLLGGGIGIPPMLELVKELKAHMDYLKTHQEENPVAPDKPYMATIEESDITVILGYRGATEGEFLKADLEKYARVLVATEDGSSGTKGNVLDALRAAVDDGTIKAPQALCSCGPLPMLRAVKSYAIEQDIPAYLSLEERMACGVGVCLGCVAKTHKVDEHSKVKNARICTEGPVFEARDVRID